MPDSLRKLHAVITTLCYGISIVFYLIYLNNHHLETLLYTVVMVFIAHTLFCFHHLKYQLIHALFYMTIFIFLFSRPLIDYLRIGSFETYQQDAYVFTFNIILVSLLGLWLGGMIGVRYFIRKKENPVDETSYNRLVLQVRRVSIAVFWITYPFYVLRLLERLIFRLQTTYYGYYANFTSKLPYFTYILSAFMFYALCVYLATKPSKKSSIFILSLYVASNLIHLVIGTRNPFILSLLFAFVYFFMRHYSDKKEIWLGRREKIALGVGTPVLMLAMGAMNYIRDGAQLKFDSIFALLVDFIYKQGTSFGVLARGYLYRSSLPIREMRNFTFGPIIDYFYRGNIGINLLGTTAFKTTTNSIELALESNSYAHNISYLVLKQEYLDGHGIGSSYMMEIYTDYGFIGLFITSCILGFIFIALINSAYRKTLLGFTISLLVLGNLFFMARSSFSESFFSLFTMQFWVVIILIFLISYLMKKPIYHTTLAKDGYIHV
ncbi:O-antigen polysaccharide polymerase Wzy family protein [uncultured Granulicatella sp.]|uniref:O-antigen polysaccharide polymerase Wzy family protein n=1 Tax=uncultured Granulicatella sp. TaxID=316089 RepID=UPI0028D60A52|nr:O-antigen polysaccharide polymerase Wzy family protein [uncultured Granulicatella sp.]